MTCRLNPETLLWAASRAVGRAVRESAEGAVNVAVDRAVLDAVRWAVWDAAEDSVWRVVSRAVHLGPPHPNLDRFVGEVRQAWWGAP